jgi:hypothetical protein
LIVLGLLGVCEHHVAIIRLSLMHLREATSEMPFRHAFGTSIPVFVIAARIVSFAETSRRNPVASRNRPLMLNSYRACMFGFYRFEMGLFTGSILEGLAAQDPNLSAPGSAVKQCHEIAACRAPMPDRTCAIFLRLPSDFVGSC